MPSRPEHPLAARFETFGGHCAQQDSPFYERLSRLVATDEELLDLAAQASREPVPNLFFAAVHYLLLKGADHELRDYYRSIATPPREDDDLLRAFSGFCRRARVELTALLFSRLVQTNEVNRSAILAPAISVAYTLGSRQPMALVEVGASAGLNLLWDRYRIRYSDGSMLGDPSSSVHIDCENRGASLPSGMEALPVIAERIGIDRNPIDLHDPDEQLWLRALVWPDHRRRAERLEAALALAGQFPRRLVRGDALTVLPGVLDHVPRRGTLCVYQSSVLYQFTPDERDRFRSLLAAASRERPVWHVSAESEEGLRLLRYRDGTMAEERSLGAFDAHGRWICWEGRVGL